MFALSSEPTEMVKAYIDDSQIEIEYTSNGGAMVVRDVSVALVVPHTGLIQMDGMIDVRSTKSVLIPFKRNQSKIRSGECL